VQGESDVSRSSEIRTTALYFVYCGVGLTDGRYVGENVGVDWLGLEEGWYVGDDVGVDWLGLADG
jgi:hypothetical protein